MMVGVDGDMKILDYQILQHNETPGLGEIAKKEKFRKRIRGRGLDNLEVTKRGEPGKIDAITGATITTDAVVKGLKKGLEELKSTMGAEQKAGEPKEGGGHE